jgi:hypothetical protein
LMWPLAGFTSRLRARSTKPYKEATNATTHDTITHLAQISTPVLQHEGVYNLHMLLDHLCCTLVLQPWQGSQAAAAATLNQRPCKCMPSTPQGPDHCVWSTIWSA